MDCVNYSYCLSVFVYMKEGVRMREKIKSGRDATNLAINVRGEEGEEEGKEEEEEEKDKRKR